MSLLFLCIQGRPFFDSVVLVVRNPFHALVSEWNRELSTKYGLGQGNGTAHTNVYGREYFRELLKTSLHIRLQVTVTDITLLSLTGMCTTWD